MTEKRLSPSERAHENERRRRRYAKEVSKYDKEMNLEERLLFGSEHRTLGMFPSDRGDT